MDKPTLQAFDETLKITAVFSLFIIAISFCTKSWFIFVLSSGMLFGSVGFAAIFARYDRLISGKIS